MLIPWPPDNDVPALVLRTIQADHRPLVCLRLIVDFWGRVGWLSAPTDIVDIVLIPAIVAGTVVRAGLWTSISGAIVKVAVTRDAGKAVGPGNSRGGSRPAWLYIVGSIHPDLRIVPGDLVRGLDGCHIIDPGPSTRGAHIVERIIRPDGQVKNRGGVTARTDPVAVAKRFRHSFDLTVADRDSLDHLRPPTVAQF